jgi:hypothetical protein
MFAFSKSASRPSIVIVAVIAMTIGGKSVRAQDEPSNTLLTEHLIGTFHPVSDESSDSGKLSEFWIGIDGVPADEILRTQLELVEGQGIVVNQIVANSPAERAGLQRFDVLFSVGNKSLGEIGDLSAVIKSSRDKPLTLRAVRRAKQIVVEVTPERRPPSQSGATCPGISRVDDGQFIRSLFLDVLGKVPADEEVKQFQEDRRTEKRSQLALRLLSEAQSQSKSCNSCHTRQEDQTATRVLGHWLAARNLDVGQSNSWLNLIQPRHVTLTYPAVIDPPAQDLPEDVTIVTTHQGKQPLKIVVTKGGEKWETTGEQLEQLPEPIRVMVRQALGASVQPGFQYSALNSYVGMANLANAIAPNAPSEPSNPVASPASPAAAFDRLDQLFLRFQSELDELRKVVKEIRPKGEPGK